MIQRLLSEVPTECGRINVHGRRLGRETVDLDVVRRWIERCAALDSNLGLHVPRRIQSITLIDVRCGCIAGPFAVAPDYVALSVCLILPEGYLWVDSLCILQDSSAQKWEDIN